MYRLRSKSWCWIIVMFKFIFCVFYEIIFIFIICNIFENINFIFVLFYFKIGWLLFILLISGFIFGLLIVIWKLVVVIIIVFLMFLLFVFEFLDSWCLVFESGWLVVFYRFFYVGGIVSWRRDLFFLGKCCFC